MVKNRRFGALLVSRQLRRAPKNEREQKLKKRAHGRSARVEHG